MRALSGKELCKLLEQHGWRRLRTQGSHFIYGKAGSVNRLSVPVHGNRALKQGLQRHLLKLAGLTEEHL
jgi:predicted RNA binding protein YcfA (HicA-like mRNA interferase family)